MALIMEFNTTCKPAPYIKMTKDMHVNMSIDSKMVNDLSNLNVSKKTMFYYIFLVCTNSTKKNPDTLMFKCSKLNSKNNITYNNFVFLHKYWFLVSISSSKKIHCSMFLHTSYKIT